MAASRSSHLTTRLVHLSDSLAKVVGSKAATRVEVTKKLWSYIKEHNLQDAGAKSIIKADDTLAELFGGASSVKHTELLRLLKPHITDTEAAANKAARDAAKAARAAERAEKSSKAGAKAQELA